MILASIGADVWLSGFVGGVIGGAMCGFVTGLYIQWERRELARHNLRAIAIRMGVHVKQCKGGPVDRTEPWTVYMDEAISAFHRYRAITRKKARPALDAAWKSFQGVDPHGDSFLDYKRMLEFDDSRRRVAAFITFLS